MKIGAGMTKISFSDFLRDHHDYKYLYIPDRVMASPSPFFPLISSPIFQKGGLDNTPWKALRSIGLPLLHHVWLYRFR